MDEVDFVLQFFLLTVAPEKRRVVIVRSELIEVTVKQIKSL